MERTTTTVLRLGCALCFVGHGALGLQQNPAWLPFYDVVGVAHGPALASMVVIGAVDVAAGLLALLRPTRGLFFWMATWSFVTCLLRPVVGISVFEAIERSANVAVPLALTLSSSGPLWTRLGAIDVDKAARSAGVGGALALLGHGWLSALERKPTLLAHWQSIGAPDLRGPAGAAEIGLGLAILLWPRWPILVVAAAWKVATELLFLTSGSSALEVVERGATFSALIACALVLRRRSLT